MIGQMTALKQSAAAWEGILAATVAKCFSHTGLVVFSPLPNVADQEDHQVER